MEDERPKLTVIEGGRSKVRPTTGLTEGQPSRFIGGEENQNFVTRVRRVLSGIAKKLDTNPQNKPPTGKAY